MNMDYKYINQLLERYWVAETTLEEEEILRAFFSQKDLPAEFMGYRDLFVYTHVETHADVLGDDFDERLLSQIDEEPVSVKAHVMTLGYRLRPLFRAAAIVAIILTLGNALQVPFQHDEMEGSMAVTESTVLAPSVAMNTDSAVIDTMQQSKLIKNDNDIKPQPLIP